jgi:hypothetical protein
MPDDFIEIARCEKTVLSAADGNNMKAIEKLYTNKRTYNSMTDEQKERYKWNVAEQMTLF